MSIVLFYCDNMFVVYILQSGTSKVPAMMDLVQSLFFVYAKNNIVCTATDINTLENSTVEKMWKHFWKMAPYAHNVTTQPAFNS